MMVYLDGNQWIVIKHVSDACMTAGDPASGFVPLHRMFVLRDSSTYLTGTLEGRFCMPDLDDPHLPPTQSCPHQITSTTLIQQDTVRMETSSLPLDGKKTPPKSVPGNLHS